MNGHSEMTSNFIIFHNFFEIERGKQEDDMQNFDRGVLTDLNIQIKGLGFAISHLFLLLLFY